MRPRIRLNVLLAVCTVSVGLTSAATASAAESVSANGNNVLDSAKAVVSSLDMSCGDTVYGNSPERPCSVTATGTIRVSAAVRKKLRLPSAVVAKGSTVKDGPSNYRLDLKASAAVRKRLKAVASVPVVLELQFTSPSSFTRPITEDLKMVVAKPGKSATGIRRVLFRWDKDGGRLER